MSMFSRSLFAATLVIALSPAAFAATTQQVVAVSLLGEASQPMSVKVDNTQIKAGKVEYRLDKTNIVHTGIGKVSFGPEKLVENFKTLLDAVIKAKPAAAKGQYLRSVTIATTMGPGIKVYQAKL